MSTRAIAAATGISQGTVRNDLAEGAQDYAPVVGMDGKTYQSSRPAVIEPEIVDAEVIATVPFGTVDTVTSLDTGASNVAPERIDLAETVAQLTIVNAPQIANEGQARAIKPVLRDHGPEVAAEVLREAADVAISGVSTIVDS